MHGNLETIALLLRAGASCVGRDIPRIANMETANFLQRIGLLPSILLTNGTKILISATKDNKRDLTTWLLNYGIDDQVHHSRSSVQRSVLWWSESPLEVALTQKNITLTKALLGRGAVVTERELNAIIWQTLEMPDTRTAANFLTLFRNRFPAPNSIAAAILADRTDIVALMLRSGLDPHGKVLVVEPAQLTFDGLEDLAGWWNINPEVLKTKFSHSSLGAFYASSSVLEAAARAGSLMILKMLLQSTTWTRQEKGLALTESIVSGNHYLARTLLAAGASVNQKLIRVYPLDGEMRYVSLHQPTSIDG
ncbi:hypothetical protein N7532_005090 [Penicillium argentinense]|uniref:Ankyrin repeat protein n=1 Tax=Penicillium argentinense TaxID=1131581 RepID=A0A9W9FDH8_9EURO|nr:uncharacterized protein N7532_005090 [Penicillium argentinense]KAJ5098089.1 hypothetical protein N7532_005090 [Penicillium argentinense]